MPVSVPKTSPKRRSFARWTYRAQDLVVLTAVTHDSERIQSRISKGQRHLGEAWGEWGTGLHAPSSSGVTQDTLNRKQLRQSTGSVVCGEAHAGPSAWGFAGAARAGGLSPQEPKVQAPGRQAGVRREAGRSHTQLRSVSRSG